MFGWFDGDFLVPVCESGEDASVPGFEIPRQMVVQAQADGISIVHRPLAAAFSFCCSLRKCHLEHV